jgi:hypothetical protein
MRPVALILLLTIIATACSDAEPDTNTTAGGAAGTSPTTVDPAGLVAPCLVEIAGYVPDGALVVGDGVGDATTLSSIRWETYPGCDRVEFGFLAASGAPASAVGTSVATLTSDAGVVRIQYPEGVSATGPSDTTIETDLVTAVYVVWTREGRLVTDLHLSDSQPVVFAASSATSPARTVIDLRPGAADGVPPTAPLISETLVLVSPTGGSATYPLRVTGYARGGDGQVVVRYRVAGAIVEERRTPTAGDGSSWGEFTLVIDDGPSGAAELFVGHVIGELEAGVTVTLEVE